MIKKDFTSSYNKIPLHFGRDGLHFIYMSNVSELQSPCYGLFLLNIHFTLIRQFTTNLYQQAHTCIEYLVPTVAVPSIFSTLKCIRSEHLIDRNFELTFYIWLTWSSWAYLISFWTLLFDKLNDKFRLRIRSSDGGRKQEKSNGSMHRIIIIFQHNIS